MLRVIETCLYVDDLKAAESFYQDVLGLKLFASVPDRHLFFAVDGGVLLLFNPEATSHEGLADVPLHGARGEGHVAFAATIDELDSWRSRPRRGRGPHRAGIRLGEWGPFNLLPRPLRKLPR